MKVLWVCNIALPVIARQLHLEVSNKEGWLSGLAGTLLERRHKNGIELSVAFPMQGNECPEGQEIASMRCYGFPEDVRCPEKYDENLEHALKKIVDKVRPDVVHCFGTEYPHTLAMCRIFPDKDRVLVGLQGLCTLYAQAYFADLPEKVVFSVTFRDWLKRDSLRQQQEKFVLRGNMERESISLAGNVTGRTRWDRDSAAKWNPHARYHLMNETLRPEFYGPVWKAENCIPHSIFVSQGDYPLKGLHYMLLAMPKILEKYPDAQVYVAGNSLVNYGTPKEKLKISAYGRYLRKLLKDGGLADKVSFTGKMSAEQMRDRYLASSLFVCPSSLENSPNSLGEAMLLGMPCVCAAVGGIPSIFTAGEDGILYQGFVMPDESRTACTAEGGRGREAECAAAGGRGREAECTAEGGRGREAECAAAGGRGAEPECAVSDRRERELECTAAGREERELERIAGELAAAVIQMWEHPDRQRIYCENARNHAKNTHNREENYARLIEIYTDIAEGRETEQA